jgi:hypothetical protein
MTETTAQVAGTAVEQVAPGSAAYALATDPSKKWALAALLEALDGTPEKTEEIKAPAAPDVIEVKDELRTALRVLAQSFGRVQPSEARKLEKTETVALTTEMADINAVLGLLGKRAKAIDEAMRNHMDAIARDQGITGPVIATGIAEGHILAAKAKEPFEVRVEGFADAWQQRLVKGKSELSLAVLSDMKADGRITQAEFNALTVPVRELDEGKIKTAVKRSPARVLGILKAATVRKPDTASLYSPKK